MSTGSQVESSIPSHLLRADRTPKHRPGTYEPPYPSFSARFPQETDRLVTAYFGVQVRDAGDRALSAALDEIRRRFESDGGPDYWDRARYVDGEGYLTVISIAYWTELSTYENWFATDGRQWTAQERATDGVGYFLELVTPSVDRVETIFSANDRVEGMAGAAPGLSGMIEEHAYWGSMRDRMPLSQSDPLYPTGKPHLEIEGNARTVVLNDNACLIRSGQDLTDTGEVERAAYVTAVAPSLIAGMEFLRDEGHAIGCFDNRFMTVLDKDDQPTERTFGVSWWASMSHLEEWSASHPTHLQIFSVAMRHLSSFGPDTRLRLYHEVMVPTAVQQRFVYVGCHDRTGLLRAVVT